MFDAAGRETARSGGVPGDTEQILRKGHDNMNIKRIPALLVSLALLLGLAACAPQGEPQRVSTPTPAADTPEPAASPTREPQPAPRGTVNLGLLKGPTGMGAAKLLADNDAGTTALDYHVTLGSDPANDIVPKLINGELDVAAVPTNLAAALYNKTQGGVRLLALNTLGVLHILENGDSVHTLADLSGKTLYATGQGANPEYVLNYLLEQNGLTPGEDVTIEWRASDELTALMAAGEISLCMLPVPAAAGVMIKNQEVRDAVDLNDAWTQSGAPGTFTMGCLAARTEWVEEHPDWVSALLEEYAASIAYINGEGGSDVLSGPASPPALIAQFEITPNATIAAAAIPQANLVYVDGRDLLDIASYYEVLFAADPTSIGGAIPDDAFYYMP